MKKQTEFALKHIKIGDVAPDYVVALAQMNPELKSLGFRIYSPIPGVNERLANPGIKSAKATVANFLRHENVSAVRWEVLARDLTPQLIRDKVAEVPNDQALALDAKCHVQDGSANYFAMMDFSAPPNQNNLELLSSFVEGIACDGIIVDSGASYHFYGFELLDYHKWVAFMGKCLLAPWSDSRWIGHSLIENGGDLRISPTRLKQKLPSVVEIVAA